MHLPNPVFALTKLFMKSGLGWKDICGLISGYYKHRQGMSLLQIILTLTLSPSVPYSYRF